VHVQIVLLQLLNVSIHIWLSHFHDNVGIRTWASYHLGLNTAGVFGEITDALLSVEVSITTADLQGALVATDVVVVAPLGRCHQESIGFAGAHKKLQHEKQKGKAATRTSAKCLATLSTSYVSTVLEAG